MPNIWDQLQVAMCIVLTECYCMLLSGSRPEYAVIRYLDLVKGTTSANKIFHQGNTGNITITIRSSKS